MTAELPPSDDDEYEAPIERVLRAAMLAEAAQASQRTEESPATPNEVVQAQVEPKAAVEPAERPTAVAAVAEAPAQAGPVPGPEPAEPEQDDVVAMNMAGPADTPIETVAVEEPGQPQLVGEIPAANEPPAATATPEAIAAWTEALRSVERSVNEAADAIRFLRATIQQMAPVLRSIEGLEELVERFDDRPQRRPDPPALNDILVSYEGEIEAPPPGPTLLPQREDPAERDWSLQRRKPPVKDGSPRHDEPEAAWTAQPGPTRHAAKPVTLVPDDTPALYAYRVTIEDRQGPVQLVQLHRALAGLPAVRNLLLLNYVGGVASLSLEAMEEIQPSELENVVKKVLKRNCSVVLHESNVMLVQMGD